MQSKMEDKVIICRCEELTQADIRKAIKDGYKNPEEIKRMTRCGMGPCQGNTCRELVVREVAAATGKKIEEVEIVTYRPPVKPIKFKSMLGVEANDS